MLVKRTYRHSDTKLRSACPPRPPRAPVILKRRATATLSCASPLHSSLWPMPTAKSPLLPQASTSATYAFTRTSAKVQSFLALPNQPIIAWLIDWTSHTVVGSFHGSSHEHSNLHCQLLDVLIIHYRTHI